MTDRKKVDITPHLYTLLAARAAVKLERIGMRHSSGRSVRKHWALILGFKSNATHDVVIEALTAEVRKIKNAIQA